MTEPPQGYHVTRLPDGPRPPRQKIGSRAGRRAVGITRLTHETLRDQKELPREAAEPTNEGDPLAPTLQKHQRETLERILEVDPAFYVHGTDSHNQVVVMHPNGGRISLTTSGGGHNRANAVAEARTIVRENTSKLRAFLDWLYADRGLDPEAPGEQRVEMVLTQEVRRFLDDPQRRTWSAGGLEQSFRKSPHVRLIRSGVKGNLHRPTEASTFGVTHPLAGRAPAEPAEPPPPPVSVAERLLAEAYHDLTSDPYAVADVDQSTEDWLRLSGWKGKGNHLRHPHLKRGGDYTRDEAIRLQGVWDEAHPEQAARTWARVAELRELREAARRPPEQPVEPAAPGGEASGAPVPPAPAPKPGGEGSVDPAPADAGAGDLAAPAGPAAPEELAPEELAPADPDAFGPLGRALMADPPPGTELDPSILAALGVLRETFQRPLQAEVAEAQTRAQLIAEETEATAEAVRDGMRQLHRLIATVEEGLLARLEAMRGELSGS